MRQGGLGFPRASSKGGRGLGSSSVWSPRPLWTAPEDGRAAHAQVGALDHDAALDLHPGGAGAGSRINRAASSKRRGSAIRGWRRHRCALRWLLSWAVLALSHRIRPATGLSHPFGRIPRCTVDLSRPTRPGGLAHPHMVRPRDHDALAPSEGKGDGIAAYGAPLDGGLLHPPPSGTVCRHPRLRAVALETRTKSAIALAKCGCDSTCEVWQRRENAVHSAPCARQSALGQETTYWGRLTPIGAGY